MAESNESTNAISDLFINHRIRFDSEKLDIIHQYGIPIDFVLYSELFRPVFIEIVDSVLLLRSNDDVGSKFLEARTTSKMDLHRLEESFNLIEIAYLFSRTTYIDLDLEYEIANIIRNCWTDALKIQYSGRTFNISIYSPEETGSVVGVGFYEIRKTL